MNIAITNVQNIPHSDELGRNIQNFELTATIDGRTHTLDVYRNLDNQGAVEFDNPDGLDEDAQDDLFLAVVNALPA